MRLVFARPEPRPGDPVTLPARRLVEFRCRKRGHLLGVIYTSREGPLFVSAATDAKLVDEQGMRLPAYETTIYSDEDGNRETMKYRPTDPSPRLPDTDEPSSDVPAPLNCRCGVWPDVPRDGLKSALAAARDSKATVYGVSDQGIHSSGGTLFYKF